MPRSSNHCKTHAQLACLTLLWLASVLNVQASLKPLPVYFRYELLKSGALTNLVVGDFDGDGLADIAGLTRSQRDLVVMHAKGKFSFRSCQSFRMPSRVQSLLALDLAGKKHSDVVALISSPSRAQLWHIGEAGRINPKKQTELPLPEGTDQLYLLSQHSSETCHFFARTETGTLTAFSLHKKEGFSTDKPLSLSHRVSAVFLPNFSTSDFFTQAVGENVLWLHRPPPNEPLAIRCKESVSLAATTDFNRNELLDLVIAQAIPNRKTAVEVMFDVGVETGVSPIRFETLVNPKQIFIQDFNGDGLLDIGLSDGVSFVIHFAQSTTAFLESMVIAFSDETSGVTVADLNQDGKPEIIVSEQKAGKLVVYSTSHYELLGVERLATSGAPTQIDFHSDRKQLFVGSNRHHQIEAVQIDRHFSRSGSFSVAGKIVSLWQDEVEMIWLTASPVTVTRKRYKSEQIISHRLFSLGISQSLLWRGSESQSAILAVLEERTNGALPQLLFYALNRDSALSISEMLLDKPVSAESIVSIGGATLKKKNYLVVLKSEKNANSVIVYELNVEKSRLSLTEVEKHAFSNLFAQQGARHLLVKVNKNETMDFLVTSSKSGILLLSERLYQPQQISNFPKLNTDDIVLWRDGDGDELADLIISRHQRAELLFLRGHPKGSFDMPKIILSDVIATSIASGITKQHATLFVANAKLHTVDILRLKK